MFLDDFGLSDAVELSSTLRRIHAGASSMEEVASRTVAHLRESLVDRSSGKPACALVRLFKTHELGAFEGDLRDLAVASFAAGGHGALPEAKCLTLMATAGDEPEWCDRRRSKGHALIPLPSAEAVRQAPMIAAMTEQFGFGAEALVGTPPLETLDDATSSFNVFHVEDAAGSPLIPSQEQFVIPYGIRSVLGFGGMFPSGNVFTVVLFSRMKISRDVAELFRPVALSVKVALLSYPGARIFTDDTNDFNISPLARTTARIDTLEQVLEAVERTTQQKTAERQAAMDRLAMLAEAGRALTVELDVDATVASLVSLVVPTFGQWCCVHLLDGDQVHFVRAHHSDPSLQPALDELLGAFEVTVHQPYGAGYALATGRSQLLPEVADDVFVSLAAGDVAALARLRALKMGGGLVVPLKARGHILGAVTVATGTGIPMTNAEQALVEDIAGRAALAIDNGRLFEAQRNIAVTLQHNLLPTLPDFENLELSARYIASSAEASIGGDWYDAFNLPDGMTGLAVGDVMGHDIPAATAMGQLRSVLRTCAWADQRPADVLNGLDNLVKGFQMADLATVVYLRLEPRSGADPLLRYANAGHPPPLLIPPGGEPVLLEDGCSALIGAPVENARNEAVVEVPVGSTILLYTDGLIEVPGEDIDDGLARLLRAATEHHGSSIETFCDRMFASLHQGDGRDDVALLAVRITSQSS